MAVWQLDDELWFPNPHFGEENGLVAVGGDLSIERLLLAYSHGFFPWYSFRDSHEPRWYCPMDRYVIFPNEIHISHSMKQLIRQHRYVVTVNQDFEGVIRGCSVAQGRDDQDGAWLGPDIIDAFTTLHRMGYAASVEVWEPTEQHHRIGCAASVEGQEPTEQRRRRLVGGLYGVTLRNAFFGESMFSIVPNASKLALICLAKGLEAVGACFIDCQFETPHLASMGGRHITYDHYMELLGRNS